MIAPLSGIAQTPKIPSVPSAETISKNAAAAEKAEAAQKAAEKAAAAQKAADKAEAAKKAAETAAIAQRSAEKAAIAQKAAETAVIAQKSSEKATEAQKASDKATAAQQAAEKAAAAQKAAETAASAQKSAEKAAVAQKSAESALIAQKSAEKAAAAQKAMETAVVAQKSAEKAAGVQKTAEKATAASGATEKAAARQAAVEKLNAVSKTATQAETAQKASERAASAAAGKTVAPAPEVVRIRALNQPAGAKGKDGAATREIVVTGEPRNPIAEREAKEAAARGAGDLVKAPVVKESVADEERRLVKDTVRDGLANLEVAPEVASKLADDFVDPDKAEGAKDRVGVIADASVDLQLVAVSDEKRKEVIDAVSRSKDPQGTADEKVGEAATEEVFGKDVAKLVPGEKRGQFREVFKRLADVRGGLEVIGGDPDDPEVVAAVKEGAERGITTKEESRELFERAGQKVLDRQGFSPAKEGESFDARLARLAKEQEAEMAAIRAAQAAKAAAAAAKARLGKGTPTLGDSITQGAAGSSAVGRSVSVRVEVAVGGGKGRTSGAGNAAQGTGTDASRTTGTGGRFQSDLASSRLAADTGGTSSAAKPTTGRADAALPGTATPPTTSAPTAPGALEQGTGVNGSQTPVANAPTAPVSGSGSGTPNSTVSSPANDIVVGGGQGSSFGGHFQSPDGNTGGDLTFNPDGTFSGTVTTVTRDASGNITSSTQTGMVGTWGVDANGNVVVTSATTTPSTSSNNNQSTPPASGNQSNGTGTNNGNSSETSSEDDDDDDDDDDKDDPPPPADETKTEEAPAEETTEATTEAATTPNPMDIGGGDPSQLFISTGGKLGGQEARRQQRALELAGSGGGAGGPNATDKGSSGVLLTPEEQANAARLIGVKTGGAVTNPNPLDGGTVTITQRDLDELYLRGNGGAKGPTDATPPALPQDPNSPLGGVPGIVAPGGGTRVNAQVPAAAVRVDADKAKVNVDAQIKESVK
ncbi:hypothetical protein CMV30_10440 [Nibricoccus aquaticus]|uniref:Uncharacterized protein n=1 Tax=Nibricoccus aquaticus TaxID=2576891 RepID=A0A290Q6S0_9BACT|nr:hypothetical protein CMV30_10440 [Nibricoccus aquaticus]